MKSIIIPDNGNSKTTEAPALNEWFKICLKGLKKIKDNIGMKNEVCKTVRKTK